MQYCIGKPASVTADDVVALQAQIEERTKELDELIQLRNDIARRLWENGDNMVARDGSRIIYDAGGRREVLPEMVQAKYPDVYDRIVERQLSAFQPRMSIKELQNHLGKEQIDELVVEKAIAPKVIIRRA